MLSTESSSHDGTETAAVAALAAQAAGVQTIEQGGRTWLAKPNGEGRVDLEEITAPGDVKPGRLAVAVALAEPTSLAEYAKRFSTATGVLFGDVESGVIRALLDYHTPTVDSDGAVTEGGPAATHNEHRATLTLRPSVEWDIWTKASGGMVSQLEFARFIEENAPDIVSPSGADLLEIARDFHAVRKADFRQIVRTDSDNERLEFTDETTPGASQGGRTVEVPTVFKISIPVYFGEPPVTLEARFRWAQNGTELKLGMKLTRLLNVKQAEFRRILTDLSERTGFPAYFGKPTAS